MLAFTAALLLFLASVIWIYRDAKSRGKPGVLVAVLAAVLVWPVSLLVWIALRPPIEPRDGTTRGRRPFNLQDFRQQ